MSMLDSEKAVVGYNPAFVRHVHAKPREEGRKRDRIKTREDMLALRQMERRAKEQREAEAARRKVVIAKATLEQMKMAEMKAQANESVRAANAALAKFHKAWVSDDRRRGLSPAKRGFHQTSMTTIMRRICAATGVPPQDIVGKRRSRHVAFARQAVMYWAVRLTGRSLPEIGRSLGGKDHTTCIAGHRAYVKKRAAMGRMLRSLDRSIQREG
jgi:chromosomal replication initiation ATPase DnaA